MLGISFRMFCGLCDSDVDFRSPGVIWVVLWWLLGCIVALLGCLWSAWGAIWVSFRMSLGCCGGSFWGFGGAPGRLRCALAFKYQRWLLSSLHVERCWRPKGPQTPSKIELQSVRNGLKHRSTFLFEFLSVPAALFMIVGRFLRHCTCEN